MERFYAQMIAQPAQAMGGSHHHPSDKIMIALARLTRLDCTQFRRLSARFAWNNW